MNPEDLAAAVTPQAIQAIAQMELLKKAKRKNAPGPGGIVRLKLPTARKMNTQEASDSSSLQDFLARFQQ